MLIRGAAHGFDPLPRDLRIEDGGITEIASRIAPRRAEELIEAQGCTLLPGLHDHHLHLHALAASLDSVRCGHPDARDAESLIHCLREADARCNGDWLRGFAYHESVAGEIDRHWLDRVLPHRALRVQHRSGRLWIFNTRALELLGAADDSPLERDAGGFTGRLYDADAWLRSRLQSSRPSLARASRLLAARGVTGITDTTPGNDLADYRYFDACQRDGSLLQRMVVMGKAEIAGAVAGETICPGPLKLHLHEHDLPELDQLVSVVRETHRLRRAVAMHCTTLAELALGLQAIREAGPRRGDRIEHASVVPPDWLPLLRETGVSVVTQPHFVLERGDRYIAEIDAGEHDWLYRARSLLDAGIALAAGSDAPFGDPDPWHAMQAAVDRRTADDRRLGAAETLSPEQALALFLGDPLHPGKGRCEISVGMRADLCLLDRDWRSARRALAQVRVRLCLKDGVGIAVDTLP